MALPTFDEDRGLTLIASAGPNKGSSRPTVANGYLKDLKGCGTKEYSSVGDSMTIVEYVDCVQRPLCTVSISVTALNSDNGDMAGLALTDVTARILAKLTELAAVPPVTDPQG